jgi:hypothetical protein
LERGGKSFLMESGETEGLLREGSRRLIGSLLGGRTREV